MRWIIDRRLPWKRLLLACGLALCWLGGVALAQDGGPAPPASDPATDGELDLRELFRAGGLIGVIIVGLSVATVALVVEHLLSIRRSALMPKGLAENSHNLILRGQFDDAKQACLDHPSFLGSVIVAGVSEAEIDYSSIEKAMEDSATEQSARLFRKIEYLNVIGTLAPMLGLLGTVWGMINAFLEFEAKSNPQVSELAPGIYKALVTTLLGLSVAVPAFAAFAFFRNRIDELVAESSLTAEQVFADYRRQLVQRRRAVAQRRRTGETP